MQASISLTSFFSSVYPDLQQLASTKLRKESEANRLDASELVHECFLAMSTQQQQTFQNKGHFFFVASVCMERVLLQAARRRNTHKRGGNTNLVSLDASCCHQLEDASGFEPQVKEALDRYQAFNERGGKVIHDWFFGGYKQGEIAARMGVSEKTVRREWKQARQWLENELCDLVA